MALFCLTSADLFKDLSHLVHRQVFRPSNLDHSIAFASIIQSNSDHTSNILYGHKINGIIPSPEDGGFAPLQDGPPDQLCPEIHKSAGSENSEAQAACAQIFLYTVLD